MCFFGFFSSDYEATKQRGNFRAKSKSPQKDLCVHLPAAIFDCGVKSRNEISVVFAVGSRQARKQLLAVKRRPTSRVLVYGFIRIGLF